VIIDLESLYQINYIQNIVDPYRYLS